jgi:hypothetical protein
MVRNPSCSFDFEGGGHARYPLFGQGRDLACPTAPNAPSERKGQFPGLSNRAPPPINVPGTITRVGWIAPEQMSVDDWLKCQTAMAQAR